MLLACCICRDGRLQVQATNRASADMGDSALEAQLNVAVRQLGESVGQSASHRFVSIERGENLVLALFFGAHSFACLMPANEVTSGRTHAAAGFLSDICARWDGVSGASFDSGSFDGFQSVLRAQLVHFSTAQLQGDALIKPSPDEVVALRRQVGLLKQQLSAALAEKGSGQLLAMSGREAGEWTALSTQVAELEAAKRQMEHHSAELLEELRTSRLRQMDSQKRDSSESQRAWEVSACQLPGGPLLAKRSKRQYPAPNTRQSRICLPCRIHHGLRCVRAASLAASAYARPRA